MLRVRTLEYELRPEWFLRRNVRRAIIASVLIPLIALLTYRFGPGLWNQAKVLRSQSNRLRYLDTPSAIVYEEEPNAAAALLADPLYGQVIYNGTIAGTDYDPVAKVPSDIFPFGGSALVYMHRTSSQSGDRLVQIWSKPENAEELGRGRMLVFVGDVFSLATWQIGSDLHIVSRSAMRIEDMQPGDRARVYAGQPNPADPSRFSVRFQINDKIGVVDGKLDNDGETLSMKIRME
jgi:hypothetical protein